MNFLKSTEETLNNTTVFYPNGNNTDRKYDNHEVDDDVWLQYNMPGSKTFENANKKVMFNDIFSKKQLHSEFENKNALTNKVI